MPKIETIYSGCSNSKRSVAGGGWPSSPCSMPGWTSFAVGTGFLGYSTKFNSWVELAILFCPLWDVPNNAFTCSVRPPNQDVVWRCATSMGFH